VQSPRGFPIGLMFHPNQIALVVLILVSAKAGVQTESWVEVDDDSHGSGANNVDKRSGDMLKATQSFGPRPVNPFGQ
jgi:hypothetical protein